VTCREAIDVLAEYLEAMLDAPGARALEAHLAGCDECRAYLATYRRAVASIGAAARVPMPEELRRRLRAFLLERLRDPG
jgi:anti-sigma factor RsiW